MSPLVLAMRTASAQTLAEPGIDAQLFRPAIDSAFLWVDDAHPANAGPYGALVAHYARNPLRYFTGSTLDPVVRDLAQADLVAGWVVGPAHLGVVAPVVLRSTGWDGGETGIGDLGLTARAASHLGALDLGVDGRVWFPTTGVDAAVASRGLAAEVAVVGSKDLGRFTVAADAGYRAVPFVLVDQIRVDDAVTGRLGGAWSASDAVAVTAELAGQIGVRGGGAATMPAEALGGARYRRGALTFHGGVGRGLTTAMGTPAVRVVTGLAYATPAKPVDLDADRDGLADDADDCPRLAEDPDGWRDDDGCPEDTFVTMRVVDEHGVPLPHLLVSLAGPGVGRSFETVLDTDLAPGEYTLSAADPRWADALLTFTVPDGEPRTVDLVMHPRRVTVKQDRIELDEEIRFETGSAVILRESWTLLDEVADEVRRTPQIERLRIEGHTDVVGDDEANLDLSFKRATAVRDWLVGRGIDPGRLTAVGYGESQPAAAGTDDGALALNRRVAFYVESWIGGAP